MADTEMRGDRGGPGMRDASRAPTLEPRTIQWMAGLPQNLRPNELATRFPHIANQLAARWESAADCRSYFDEVLLDSRGNRKGLPEHVALELATLKNHFDSVVFPTQQTVWDEIVGRSRA